MIPELKTIWTERKKIADERFSICQACEHLDPNCNRCRKCGCFMKLKSMYMGAECPIGKWKSVDNIPGGDGGIPSSVVD